MIRIHTSDRATFKRCRRRWDWTSPMRENLRPKVNYFGVVFPLWFGTLFHRSLEEHYDPVMKRDPIEVFQTEYHTSLDVFRKEAPDYVDEYADDFQKHYDMGMSMLTYYKEYAAKHDDFTVIATEQDFQVLLGYTDGRKFDPFLVPHVGWEPVYYCGRMDAVVRDNATGRYGIIDHKTAASFGEEYFDKLDMDEQCSCVPYNTEALTPNGWKHRKDLSVGDLILAYDASRGMNDWTPIRAIHDYDEAEIVTLRNQQGTFVAHTTPNHRWIGSRYEGQGHTRIEQWEPTTADFPKANGKVILSAPSITEGTLDITPDEAAFIGWVLTDGCIGRYAKSRLQVSIGQSETKYAEEIRQLVERLGYEHSAYETLTVNSDIVHCNWQFHVAPMSELFDKAGIVDKNDATTFILGLSKEARTAFCNAIMKAEGSRRDNTFHQYDGPVKDACKLAFFLEGKYCSVGSDKWFAVMDSPQRDSRTLYTEQATRQPVWCVSTDFGTWVMRQGRTMAITGNSYMWAAQEYAKANDLPYKQIDFVIYNVLRKCCISPPTVLESGKLSIARATESTTHAMFMQAVNDHGLQWWVESNPKAQAYIDYLSDESDNLFVKRAVVRRNAVEISNLAKRVRLEVADMLDASVYPNPTGDWYCTKCPFRAPCLAANDGSDYQEMLSANYTTNMVGGRYTG